MNLSKRGVEFISKEEGVVLKRYKDVAGFPTIGIGHLITGLEKPPIGDAITHKRALELFQEDVQYFETMLETVLEVELTQSQFDACLSLMYNIGYGGFKKSSVLRHINHREMLKAGNAFLLWNKAGGKVRQGLVKRRRRERNLFLNGEY